MTLMPLFLSLVNVARADAPAPPADAEDAVAAEDGTAGPGTKKGRDAKRGTRGSRTEPAPHVGTGAPPADAPDRAADGAASAAPKVEAHPIKPYALLQLWGTVYGQDTDVQADASGVGDPEQDPGVAVKRLRLGFRGKEQGVRYELTVGYASPYDGLDATNGRFDVVDANLGYEKAGFGVVAGRMLLPFSRDNLMSSGELTFTERGFGAQYVVPGRSMGVSGYMERAGAKATLGVYNSGSGSLLGDDNLGKTFVGRVEWSTGGDAYTLWKPRAKGVTFGVGGGAFHTSDVATTTLAAGGDALLRVGGLGVLADVAWSRISPGASDLDVPGVFEPTTRLAVTGEVSYGIGDFQPALRWSHLLDDAFGSTGQGLVGVIWHAAPDVEGRDRLKLGAGYVLRVEDDPYANDTVRIWAQVRP
jgi:hypothetical protein